jgi:two-component system chemotaxis sensor kinase CheA
VIAAKDPLRFFRIEAREISDDLGRTVLALEKSPVSGQVARLLRLAHTLKGASAVVKQRDIAEQAHALEDVLVGFRNRENAVTRDDIERILKHIDAIAGSVTALSSSPADAGRVAAPEEQVAGVSTASSDVDALLEMLSEANVMMRAARQTVGLAEQARQVSARLIEAASGSASEHGGKTQALSEELRDTLNRLDQQLKSSLDMAEREITQAHTAAERLRLLPCSAVLSPVERAVRDTAASLGKEAVFAAVGGEARLEANVLSLIQRALLQLARNAVAHGIEPPEERLRMGKPRQGRVQIEITRRGNRVAFVCRDDGRGIDMAAVRRAAQHSGKLAADTEIGGHDELVRLLFKGGLSTAGSVTELSGRGVGLDIAREVTVRLGGEISAHTTQGQGTEIELLVPTSLSAVDVLLVETGGIVCAVPLDAVRGSLQLRAGDVTRTPEGDSIAVAGEEVPFVPLARVLKRATSSDVSNLAFRVGADQKQAAVGVERLLGVANVVVRPLPELAFADPIIAGGAIDAEGIPRLVLDPRALIAAAQGLAGEAAPNTVGPPPPILVIDDSLTTRVLEQSILESAGYEVDLATSAEEGLIKARQRRYGLFLVDVEMPGMSGFEFIRTIRADAELRETPAILVTSLNAPEDLQRGVDAGAQAYVIKSEFNQVRVLETIRRCLEAA